jgi:peptidyl-prolyl cis-trans isomerase A (cyclophilin A)
LVDGSKDWSVPSAHPIQHHHGFYDGTPIHRVLPDFCIQFVDIIGDIKGKPIFFCFENETDPSLTFEQPGRLVFGNVGPDTNNSEGISALHPLSILDEGYAIIGQCDPQSVAILEHIAQYPATPQIDQFRPSSFGIPHPVLMAIQKRLAVLPDRTP